MSTTSATRVPADALAERIAARTARVAVLGPGHAADASARALADAGFPVLDRGGIADADVLLLHAPTSIGEHDEPDLSTLTGSVEELADVLRRGQLVCIDASAGPGTIRGECLPRLESSGLRAGEDFHVAATLGDVGRGDRRWLVGGLDARAAELAAQLLTSTSGDVVRVASPEVAEAACLVEAAYRRVNTALANELKPLLGEMGVDVWDVVRAAGTRPSGSEAFRPGPGDDEVTKADPRHLTWRARELGRRARLVELAGEVNDAMPMHVADQVARALNEQGRAVRCAKVLVCGLADDGRRPGAQILSILAERGADVGFHDPRTARCVVRGNSERTLQSTPLERERVEAADCVVVVGDDDDIEWSAVAAFARCVVDTRDRMAGFECRGPVYEA